MNMGVKDPSSICAQENDSASTLSSLCTGHVHTLVRVHRINDAIEGRKYDLVPPKPIRVSCSRAFMEGRKAAIGPTAQINYETVGAKRIADI